MASLKESAERFLALNRIAVAGVSSKKKDAANYIYEKLKKGGKQVYAINPKAVEIGGDPSYQNLMSTPEKVDGVIIATPPKATLTVVKECAKLDIRYVWIHKSIDNGSYSEEAEEFCLENGITLIPAGCPMMFAKPVDFPHKCIKWFLSVSGKLPKSI